MGGESGVRLTPHFTERPRTTVRSEIGVHVVPLYIDWWSALVSIRTPPDATCRTSGAVAVMRGYKDLFDQDGTA